MGNLNNEIGYWQGEMDRDWLFEEAMDLIDQNDDLTRDEAFDTVCERKLANIRSLVQPGTLYDTTEWTSEDSTPALAIDQDQFLWDGVIWSLRDIVTYHWD